MAQKKNNPEKSISENSILANKEEWRALFDAINDAILILDNDQHVILANKTSEKFFKMSIAEMIGKHCREIVGCNSNPVEGCPCLRSKKNQTRENIELKRADEWLHRTR